MIVNGLNFPNEIRDAIKEDKLVVFIGAGVSMNPPTNLPDFNVLTSYISGNSPYKYDKSIHKPDSFLGKLEHEHINVREIASNFFKERDAQPNELHRNIVKLFKNESATRIVTTNYDLSIEKAFGDELSVKVYNSPALPLGNDFQGVVHLHGNQCEPKNMILTDSDFGKAYLLEGYATRFLAKLFTEYTVLFIGYSHNDIVMNYLSRSLPTNQVRTRYILTDKNDVEWGLLGLVPIAYEEKNHQVLIESVGLLGTRINRNMIDWRYQCEQLSTTLPPIDRETIDEVLEILNNERYLEFFISKFQTINFNLWFEWLNHHEQLNSIFTESELSKEQSLLFWWLIKTDLYENDFNNFFEILRSTGKSFVNESFVTQMFDALTIDSNKVDRNTLKKILIAFEVFIEKQNPFVLFRIIEVCKDNNDFLSAYRIFRKLIKPKFVLSNKNYFDDKPDDYKGEFKFKINVWETEEVWKTFLNDHIDDLYDILYNDLSSLMETIQCDFNRFNNIDKPYDVFTHFRDIENEIMNEHIDVMEVLICKIFSDVITHSISNKKMDTKEIERKITSTKSITAQRVYLMCVKNSESIPVKTKFKIMRKFSLYDFRFKIELFRLVASIYGSLTSNQKTLILKEITSRIDKVEQNRSNNYSVFNWLVWLINSNPDDEILLDMFNRFKVYFDGFSKREHPELVVSQIESAWIRDISPITMEQLNEMSSSEIIVFLDEFQDYSPTFDTEVTKNGLLNLIFDKSIGDLNWRIDMMKYLIGVSDRKHQLWESLLRDFGKVHLSSVQMNFILNEVINEQIIKNHGVVVASFIKDIVLNKDLQEGLIQHFEVRLLEIIDLLFDHPTHNIKEDESYIMIAINGTSSDSVEAFLNLLIMRKDENGIPKIYKEYLKKFLNSENEESLLFITFIVGYYRVFYVRDDKWTINNILRCLKSDIKEDFKSAWEGILTLTPTIYLDVAEALVENYDYALENISWFSDSILKLFIDSYGVMVMYVFEKKLHMVAKLVSAIEENERIILYSTIERVLSSMKDNQITIVWQSWGLEFLKDIKVNKPIIYTDTELQSIFSWIVYSGTEFNEVITQITSMKPIIYNDTYKVMDLLKEVRGNYKEDGYNGAKIKLFEYILRCEFDGRFYHQEILEYFETLNFSSTQEKENIVNLLLVKGLIS